MDHLVACHRTFEPVERTPQEALLQLLRADSVYDPGSATQLASYVPGHVSLPTWQSQLCHLSDHLSGDAKHFLDNVETLALLDPEEEAGRNECGRALRYIDPVLENSDELYEEFIAELYRRGLVEFADRVHVVTGLFFVSKKSGL